MSEADAAAEATTTAIKLLASMTTPLTADAALPLLKMAYLHVRDTTTTASAVAADGSAAVAAAAAVSSDDSAAAVAAVSSDDSSDDSAADAADAAHSVATAAYSAADARSKTLKSCADIVRMFWPELPTKEKP